MKAFPKKRAGELIIGSKTARQISSKVTKDLKAMNAPFGNFPERHYSTRVWVGGVSVFVPPTPMFNGPGLAEIVPELKAAGYTVEVANDGRTLRLQHPYWTEVN